MSTPMDKTNHSTKGTPPAPRPRKRPPPKAPAWNQEKALELASKGVVPSNIAAVVGVHPNTVRRYLERTAPEIETLQTFRDRIGDSLVLNLAKCLDLEDKLLNSLNDGDVIANLSTGEKERLLGKVTIAKGVCFDKWRLHEGKSTMNNSHQIQMDIAYQQIDWSKRKGKDQDSNKFPSPGPRCS